MAKTFNFPSGDIDKIYGCVKKKILLLFILILVSMLIHGAHVFMHGQYSSLQLLILDFILVSLAGIGIFMPPPVAGKEMYVPSGSQLYTILAEIPGVAREHEEILIAVLSDI